MRYIPFPSPSSLHYTFFVQEKYRNLKLKMLEVGLWAGPIRQPDWTVCLTNVNASQPAMMDHVTRRPIHQGETRGVLLPARGNYGTPSPLTN
jgi:hypothetical protein